jgi:hypothetical protein
MRARIVVILACSVALVGAGRIALPYGREYVSHGVHVEIEEALAQGGEAHERSGIGRITGKIGSAVGAAIHDRITLRLLVRNTTYVPARISSVRYKVHIGGHEIGVGRWRAASGAQWFYPGRDVRITAVLDPDWAHLAGAGVDKVIRHDTPISVSGELELRVMRREFSVPFATTNVGWVKR